MANIGREFREVRVEPLKAPEKEPVKEPAKETKPKREKVGV